MDAKEWVRTAAVLLVWGVWLLALALRAVLVWSWAFLKSAWARRILWAGLLVLLLDAGIRVAPLVYGRFALLDEVAFQARTCSGRDPAQLVAALRRAAYLNGFTDILRQPEAITVELQAEEDGGTSCVITVALEQRIHPLAQLPLTIRLHKRVKERILPAEARPRHPGDEGD